jgi:hypothetical protein
VADAMLVVKTTPLLASEIGDNELQLIILELGGCLACLFL